jgi:tol-pal system-associated acyl-CoA thioesterase
MEHRYSFKIYYEDTDSLGIVYYANYLKFMERARTELIDQGEKSIQQWNQEGFNFAVYQVRIKFLKPVRLGERCEIVTTVVGRGEYRKKLQQRIERGGETVTEALVDLVCLDHQLALQPFPFISALA